MRSGYKTLALLLYNSCLAIFLSYGLFFSAISSKYGVPASATSLVFGIFGVFYTVSVLAMSYFVNIRGPRKAILLGGALMGAGLTLSSIASSFPFLLVTYGVIGGLGSGSMWVPTSYVVFDTFESRSVKRAIGIVSLGVSFGMLFFPPVESYLIEGPGPNAAFLAVGAITFIFTLAAYYSSAGSTVKYKFNFRAVTDSLRSRGFGYLYLYYSAALSFARTITLIFVVPLLESRGLGIEAGTIAVVMVGVGSLFGRLTTGTRRFAEETMAAFGFLLQGISIVGLYFSYGIPSMAAMSLVLGLGYGIYAPQFALITRKRYGIEQYSALYGILQTGFGAGAFAGPVLEGVLLSQSERLGFGLGFGLAAIVSILVSVHLLIVGRSSSRD